MCHEKGINKTKRGRWLEGAQECPLTTGGYIHTTVL